ncbi:hypothetical protein DL96DRAFT_1623952 [Flagelloscypha sp. PMI_526]|nr:hypothetical protein DL96DRAFT_1623952 [Flagelloscypha sp. PMI_526]
MENDSLQPDELTQLIPSGELPSPSLDIQIQDDNSASPVDDGTYHPLDLSLPGFHNEEPSISPFITLLKAPRFVPPAPDALELEEYDRIGVEANSPESTSRRSLRSTPSFYSQSEGGSSVSRPHSRLFQRIPPTQTDGELLPPSQSYSPPPLPRWEPDPNINSTGRSESVSQLNTRFADYVVEIPPSNYSSSAGSPQTYFQPELVGAWAPPSSPWEWQSQPFWSRTPTTPEPHFQPPGFVDHSTSSWRLDTLSETSSSRSSSPDTMSRLSRRTSSMPEIVPPGVDFDASTDSGSASPDLRFPTPLPAQPLSGPPPGSSKMHQHGHVYNQVPTQPQDVANLPKHVVQTKASGLLTSQPTSATSGNLLTPSKLGSVHGSQTSFSSSLLEQLTQLTDPGEEAGPNARAWLVYLDEAETFDKEMLEGHRTTMDILMIFHLLTLQSALAAGTAPPALPRVLTSEATLYDLWCTSLWTASLLLALAAAMIAVFVKQWLSLYASGITGTAIERVSLRHSRFMGLESWKVSLIISLLPHLLYTSLLFFFAGLALFLTATSSAFGTAIAIVALLLLPVFYPNCPYKTPLSYHLLLGFTWRKTMKDAELAQTEKRRDDLLGNALAWASSVATHPSVKAVISQVPSGLSAVFKESALDTLRNSISVEKDVLDFERSIRALCTLYPQGIPEGSMYAKYLLWLEGLGTSFPSIFYHAQCSLEGTWALLEAFSNPDTTRYGILDAFTIFTTGYNAPQILWSNILRHKTWNFLEPLTGRPQLRHAFLKLVLTLLGNESIVQNIITSVPTSKTAWERAQLLHLRGTFDDRRDTIKNMLIADQDNCLQLSDCDGLLLEKHLSYYDDDETKRLVRIGSTLIHMATDNDDSNNQGLASAGSGQSSALNQGVLSKSNPHATVAQTASQSIGLMYALVSRSLLRGSAKKGHSSRQQDLPRGWESLLTRPEGTLSTINLDGLLGAVLPLQYACQYKPDSVVQAADAILWQILTPLLEHVPDARSDDSLAQVVAFNPSHASAILFSTLRVLNLTLRSSNRHRIFKSMLNTNLHIFDHLYNCVHVALARRFIADAFIAAEFNEQSEKFSERETSMAEDITTDDTVWTINQLCVPLNLPWLSKLHDRAKFDPITGFEIELCSKMAYWVQSLVVQHRNVLVNVSSRAGFIKRRGYRHHIPIRYYRAPLQVADAVKLPPIHGIDFRKGYRFNLEASLEPPSNEIVALPLAPAIPEDVEGPKDTTPPETPASAPTKRVWGLRWLPLFPRDLPTTDLERGLETTSRVSFSESQLAQENEGALSVPHVNIPHVQPTSMNKDVQGVSGNEEDHRKVPETTGVTRFITQPIIDPTPSKEGALVESEPGDIDTESNKTSMYTDPEIEANSQGII